MSTADAVVKAVPIRFETITKPITSTSAAAEAPA
jgi:hypothetical protein